MSSQDPLFEAGLDYGELIEAGVTESCILRTNDMDVIGVVASGGIAVVVPPGEGLHYRFPIVPSLL